MLTTEQQPTGTSACDLAPLYALLLKGRLSGPDKLERACVVETAQGSTLFVRVKDGAGRGQNGSHVVYADLIGRLQGEAHWIKASGFHLEVRATADKLQRLLRQFEFVSQMPPEDRCELRGHKRILLDQRDVTLLSEVGCWDASIVNASRSGVAMLTVGAVALGEVVTVGTTRGKVVRTTADGCAVQFLRLLPLEAFNAAYRL